MHRYNNADHSMMTAMLTVENICGAMPPHDIWAVNVEKDYHEESRDSQPGADAPQPASAGTGRAAPVIPRQVDRSSSAEQAATPDHSGPGAGNARTSVFSKK
jgi:hypothetical protein